MSWFWLANTGLWLWCAIIDFRIYRNTYADLPENKEGQFLRRLVAVEVCGVFMSLALALNT